MYGFEVCLSKVVGIRRIIFYLNRLLKIRMFFGGSGNARGLSSTMRTHTDRFGTILQMCFFPLFFLLGVVVGRVG